ncbi:hypothetical protein EG68_00427 [Paragonimus skrjabini miyazakii]|uniref:Uncharacterized protein n=1 Tax=Paragonimus skrjabini miyazakii TaxID=59628 RepID=A0A8S9Z9C1_9TREM|nr:hypothetical protein EG68_00427 [Paragonimus skrjabini miyazakii]
MMYAMRLVLMILPFYETLVYGTLTLTGPVMKNGMPATWNEKYEDPESPEFRNLSEQLCTNNTRLSTLLSTLPPPLITQIRGAMPEYLSLRQGWLSCATRKVFNKNPIESEVDIELDSGQLEEQELDVNCGTFEILMNYLVKKWPPHTDQFQFKEINIVTVTVLYFPSWSQCSRCIQNVNDHGSDNSPVLIIFPRLMTNRSPELHP